MGQLCPILLLLLFWLCPECSPCMEGSSASQLCERGQSSWADLFSAERLDAWVYSLLGSLVVGLSGVLPLLVIPMEAGTTLKSKEGSQNLKQLLSFAIGGLLGDVFLHLLPEAWAYTCSATTGGVQTLQQQQLLGLWVIVGFVSFLILEKTFPDERSLSEQQETTFSALSFSSIADMFSNRPCFQRKEIINPRKAKANSEHCNGSSRQPQHTHRQDKIKISGYLNLLANIIDNFTHGMAVAGSFLVSNKVGILTTVAILLHEIPHEVGDFAILLRAGFDRWSAAKMQLLTALGAILGACFAVCAQSPKGAGETVAWILPFTSGGFLYIALVNVLPDLLEEKNPRYSLSQVCLLCAGIAVMVLLSFTAE
ncbi:zinc transporter ZIP13 isoform X2 [Microcaecilia unicolor]|uniref:Zinc transporter ZIP13 n=1 Tax=Microcaecilia unicolor TaxID=1415580 RepID=A0A6P7Y172_9AMPH|nr:zinc transporter ZIP13 isoform X2 [Microcaecilia unicolor]